TNFLDNPLDSASTPGAQSGAGRPLAMNSMTQTGTYPNCSCVFLQRLANPSLAYNPAPYDEFGNISADYKFYNPNLPINPYLTVDWHSIDVHVFNGEDTRISTNAMIMGDYDPDDANASNSPVPMRFRTRQRGYVPYNGTSYQPTSNPWPPSTKYSW